MIELGEVVQSLAARDGVDAVLLLSGDGLPIEHAARGPFDAETVAALAATLAQHAARLGHGRRAGAACTPPCSSIDGGLLVLARAGADDWLAILATADADIGPLLYDLRQHRAALAAAALMRWAVLLAGGSGTRFWPLSTPRTPKQLLPLAGSASTRGRGRRAAAGSDSRASGCWWSPAPASRPGCGPLLNLPADNFLVEPRAASTAPALIWATWEARRRDPDAEVLSLHADWAVGDAAAFRRTADAALTTARASRPAGHGRRGAVPPRDRLRLHRARARRSTTAPAPWRASPRSPTRPRRST